MFSFSDIHYMRSAVNMARRGIGRTAENPSVGCVLVKDDVVIARARTADGGRPHAETQILDKAKEAARGATLYVTLEPCAHHGQTPPCVDAIIKSGLRCVVIGMRDPDPRTSGASIEKMQDAGIDVLCDVLVDECAEIHKGFISRLTRGRPYVTLKCACTLDGKIATANNESQWITSQLSRAHVHLLRARHNAIMIGANTALYDDPMLTPRMKGVDHTITRVVMDRNLSLKVDSKLVQSAREIPLLVFYEQGNAAALSAHGVEAIQTDCSDIGSVLNKLSERGINNLLVEGGAKIHASFFKSGMFDRLMLYRAPTLLGSDAKSVVSDLNIDRLAQRLDLNRTDVCSMGADMLEIYENKD